ncbi:hypothetical protein ACFWHT_10795 [Microbacterium sp. NPDC058342]|uniref:hypothetical protein n=1 Tax=Microbacterium sp. NPDC058342 TaxID=3346454 RepID=UPI003654F18B
MAADNTGASPANAVEGVRLATDQTQVRFDRGPYDNLRRVINDVAETTSDAVWDSDGYSIGSDLRGQPAQATWLIATQVGNSVNRLATQVRGYTDTLCGKTLPGFSDAVAKAADTLAETDETASTDANS